MYCLSFLFKISNSPTYRKNKNFKKSKGKFSTTNLLKVEGKNKYLSNLANRNLSQFNIFGTKGLAEQKEKVLEKYLVKGRNKAKTQTKNKLHSVIEKQKKFRKLRKQVKVGKIQTQSLNRTEEEIPNIEDFGRNESKISAIFRGHQT